MFKKYSRSTREIKKIEKSEVSSVMADEAIVDRLTKVAEGVKKISQKSDDFLYFSIIFLKAAESAALDDNGLPKKLASGESAWCYFDDNYQWHGNVKPHRNNNHDIFPESELKKAASKWIGMPLCKDHKSDSVDGIRGIILDTHYDEKFKQVVGLCALDRVNYPDLARKVETGMVRYGSMGTAVEKSICSTCGNIATTPDNYCSHVKERNAHGEINVGLNPIEYSLVVQPAEPKAILLKCIASLQDYKSEFKKYVSDVDEMLGKLSSAQAQHLDKIMKTACGDDGCSIEKRDRIVRSFFENNKSLTKKSSKEDSDYILDADKIRNLTTSAQQAADMGDQELADKILKMVNSYVTDGYKPSGAELEESFSEASGISDTSQMQNSMNNSNIIENTFEEPILQDRPNTYEDTKSSLDDSVASLTSQTKKSIKNILEEFMDQSRLKKRAEMRRKLAYMQGGSEGKEPNTYKEEKFSHDHDKHMKQTGAIGSGDEAAKKKLSRAQLEQRAIRRTAYMQGGSEGKEPNTYKEEKFSYDHDKHMHQVKSDFNEDKSIKENLKRANYYRGLTKSSKYTGPSLRTAIKVASTKATSKLQVFAGKDLVMSIPAYEIFGNEVSQNWNWLKSAKYGQEVCRLVRSQGILGATNILKEAQAEDIPLDDVAPAPEGGAPMDAAPMDAAPAPEADIPMDEAPMDEPDLEAAPEEDEADPATEAEGKLTRIEELAGEVRSLIDEIKDQKMADVDIHVDVGGKKEEGEAGEVAELDALASEIIGQLKKTAVSLDGSADEMAMISETYDNISKISSSDKRRFVKLAKEAYSDSDEAYGEAKATVKLARSILMAMKERNHNYKKTSLAQRNYRNQISKEASDAGQEELMAEAVLLRRNRREAILKSAENRVRTSMMKKAKLQKAAAKKAKVAKQESVKVASEKTAQNDSMSRIKEKLADSLSTVGKKEAEDNFKIKLRRAYDVAMDMQKKGLISHTKTALDKQVDEILNFDDKAFESFKRSIANLKPVSNVKTASNIGSLNVGVQEESITKSASKDISRNLLAAMWDK